MGVDLLLVGRSMYSPIPRLEPSLCSSALEKYRSVRLVAYEPCTNTKERSHNQGDPRRPPPAKMALCDEAANDRSCYRPDKRRTREKTKSKASLDRAPEVCQSTANHSQRSRAEHATKEAAYHDGIHILCNGDGYLEDGENSEAQKERDLPTVELRQRPPDDRTNGEALDQVLA